MATQNFPICDPAPGVDISLDYDDVSLLVLDVNYQNLSSKNARITLTVSGTAHDVILNANTTQTTKDISGLGIHMVATTPPKGSPSIGLPSTISVNCAWPA
jgi:hypothetical protein